MTAQEGEQRQKRQSEDREEIALDALEKLRAAAFDLIGADGIEDFLARRHDVIAEETVAEIAHDEARPVEHVPEPHAVATHGNRRRQLMRLPAQQSKLAAR